MHMAFLSRVFKNLQWYGMTKKHRKLRFSMLFVAEMLKNVWVKMWVNCLTHTVTHTRKCADRFKEYRRGGFAPSPVFRILFLLTSLAP